MSDAPNQPWPAQGYTQPAAPNVKHHAPADVGSLMQQAKTAKPKRGYHRFKLPDSVKRSMYWKGCDADLHFGLYEPTSGEVRKLVKQDARFEEAAINFVAAIGVPDEAGEIRMENGAPVLADVTDNTAQAMPWWHRLSPKAQTLITTIFMEFIMPTEEEGESLRASRQWVEG